MEKQISLDIIQKWLKGWSLSRKLPLPIQYRSGFTVHVDIPGQKDRYVFAEPNEDFIQLAGLIDEPWIFLKVCAPFDDFRDKIPSRWQVQPQGYMMSCFHKMSIPSIHLHEDYRLEYDYYNATYVVRIVTREEGELASEGRVVIVDDMAIYDRISTETAHRRKGLATLLMKELERIALSRQVCNNFLVATEEGRELYKSLGWELYSLYTSIVITQKV